MLTYIRVSFWFFSKKRFGLVKKKLGYRVRVSFCFRVRVRFSFEFGIGKLIGGAVGTVGCGSRKLPVLEQPPGRRSSLFITGHFQTLIQDSLLSAMFS